MEFRLKSSFQAVEDETVRQMVVRIMQDAKMSKFEACNFVAGMFAFTNGLQVLILFDRH